MKESDVRAELLKHRTLMKNYEIEDFRVREYPDKYVVRVGRKDRTMVQEVVISKLLAAKYGSLVEYLKQRITTEVMSWTRKPSIDKQREHDEALAAGEVLSGGHADEV